MSAPEVAVEVNPHAVMCPGGAWGVLIARTSDRVTGVVRMPGTSLLAGWPLVALTFYVPQSPRRDLPERRDSRPYPVTRRRKSKL